jgi:hypothetical protein
VRVRLVSEKAKRYKDVLQELKSDNFVVSPDRNVLCLYIYFTAYLSSPIASTYGLSAAFTIVDTNVFTQINNKYFTFTRLPVLARLIMALTIGSTNPSLRQNPIRFCSKYRPLPSLRDIFPYGPSVFPGPEHS